MSHIKDSAVSEVQSLKAAAAARGIGQKSSVVVKPFQVKVRKPKPHEWVRIHPDTDNYSIVLPVIIFGDENKDDDDKMKDKPDEYVVHPALLDHPELEADANRQKEYSLATTRKGTLFIWPHSILDKENSWVDAEESNMAIARKTWIRQISNTSEGTYNRREALKDFGEPKWTSSTFETLLIEALGDYFVSSENHSIFKKLQGLE
jgi:hypothetical protein